MTPSIRVLTGSAEGDPSVLSSHSVDLGCSIKIGRESPIGVGIDPIDARVSRLAVEVTATNDGWQVAAVNSNGVDVQCWGQALLPAQRVQTICKPRIALRVRGNPDFCHWVLLEDPSLAPRPPAKASGDGTELNRQPEPLTALQMATLRTLFAEFLVWPPRLRPTPRLIKQVARLHGVTESAVKRRLEEVREKAMALGLDRRVSLTDPEYLYVLVNAGYLTPDDD